MHPDIVISARSLVGVPFRLHGRDPAFGVDCVGLVALALGRGRDGPTGYAMRGGRAENWAAMLDSHGLIRTEYGVAGDIALVEAGPGQFHLIIVTDNGFIHADAGARHVVERPGTVPWPVIGFWRDTRIL